MFFSTSSYSLPFLEALYKRGWLSGIVTGPDKAVGRKQIMTATIPKVFGKEHGVPVFECKKEMTGTVEFLKSVGAEIGLVFSFPYIIPISVIDYFKMDSFINIHPGKLPKYRGASPIQTTILNNDSSITLSFITVDEKMDAGKIVLEKEYPLKGIETFGFLLELLVNEAANLLPDLLTKPRELKEQTGIPGFTKKITKEGTFVEWKDLKKKGVYLKLRAYSPTPGLWTIIPDGKRMKILSGHLKDNYFDPEDVVVEGKTKTSWKDLVRLLGIEPSTSTL